jgi:hypothetical protein
MMMSFESSLLEIVAPQLQPLGYEYAAHLRAGDELFDFGKPLRDNLQAVVQFQVRHSTPKSFTVNLLRGMDDVCGARLSSMLWYVIGLREYPVSDYWWPANETALRDAVAKVVQYGVQWIENAHAPRPWEMPAHNGHELAEAVEVNLAPALLRRGYRLERQQLLGDVPYLYFVREFSDGTQGFIELQSVYSLDPREFQFDVRLQRRADQNPLAVALQPAVSLAQLAWQARGAVMETATPSAMLREQAVAAAVAEAKTLLWRYADRAELDKQLRDALVKIERIGLLWIDRAVG